MTDWGEASRVAGIGFGVVFLVLILLYLATLAMGLVLKRLGHQPPQDNSGQGQGTK